MRKLQEIIDSVIAGGFYGEDGGQSEFMCNAALRARTAGTISDKEYDRLCDSIRLYMFKMTGLPHRHNTMGGTLARIKGCDINVTPFSECLAVYQNWEKRPRIRSKV